MVYQAAMLVDDPAGYRETKPRPIARAKRREAVEAFEDSGVLLGRRTRPITCHADAAFGSIAVALVLAGLGDHRVALEGPGAALAGEVDSGARERSDDAAMSDARSR
jgi:hypothetical protein